MRANKVRKTKEEVQKLYKAVLRNKRQHNKFRVATIEVARKNRWDLL